MTKSVQVNGKSIGSTSPVYVIAEIGINHNGDIEIAKKLMDVAAQSGCDAVKFQKRTPEICVPEDQKSVLRETPWGTMTYFDYVCFYLIKIKTYLYYLIIFLLIYT